MRIGKLEIIALVAIVLFAGMAFNLRGKITLADRLPQSGALVYHSAEPSPREKYLAANFQERFSDLDLRAKSVIVYDLDNEKTIFSKNERDVLPIASITKVMTALTAYNLLSGETLMDIDNASLREEGKSSLVAGERWRMSDLVTLTLVSSSNDGAAALARNTSRLTGKNFENEMNRLVEELGLEATRFRNPTGLDIDVISGSYSTAFDIAKIFAYAQRYRPEIFNGTNQVSVELYALNGRKHTASNTNEAIGRLPNLIASKTGYTLLADGNLAVIVEPRPQQRIVIVVLGSTKEGRFNDTVALAERTVRILTENGL